MTKTNSRSSLPTIVLIVLVVLVTLVLLRPGPSIINNGGTVHNETILNLRGPL